MALPQTERGSGAAADAARPERGAGSSADAALLELARASGLELSQDMVSVVLELLRLDVSPQGIVAMLRSIKDGALKAAADEEPVVELLQGDDPLLPPEYDRIKPSTRKKRELVLALISDLDGEQHALVAEVGAEFGAEFSAELDVEFGVEFDAEFTAEFGVDFDVELEKYSLRKVL